MTIRLHLSAETESRLRQRAAVEGRDPADIALQALEETLGVGAGPSAAIGRVDRAAAWSRFITQMHEWT